MTRAKRLKLKRQADDLEVEEKDFRASVKEWLLSLPKSDRIQTFGKFTLAIKSKVSVAWKQAFIDEVGAEAAEELREKATPSYSADISRSE